MEVQLPPVPPSPACCKRTNICCLRLLHMSMSGIHALPSEIIQASPTHPVARGLTRPEPVTLAKIHKVCLRPHLSHLVTPREQLEPNHLEGGDGRERFPQRMLQILPTGEEVDGGRKKDSHPPSSSYTHTAVTVDINSSDG